jgi:hypothetical protein
LIQVSDTPAQGGVEAEERDLLLAGGGIIGLAWEPAEQGVNRPVTLDADPPDVVGRGPRIGRSQRRPYRLEDVVPGRRARLGHGEGAKAEHHEDEDCACVHLATVTRGLLP